MLRAAKGQGQEERRLSSAAASSPPVCRLACHAAITCSLELPVSMKRRQPRLNSIDSRQPTASSAQFASNFCSPLNPLTPDAVASPLSRLASSLAWCAWSRMSSAATESDMASTTAGCGELSHASYRHILLTRWRTVVLWSKSGQGKQQGGALQESWVQARHVPCQAALRGRQPPGNPRGMGSTTAPTCTAAAHRGGRPTTLHPPTPTWQTRRPCAALV